MELCQRCGDEGQDRRTLFMSCFYEMTELDGVPFTDVQITGLFTDQAIITQKPLFKDGPTMRDINFIADPDQKITPYHFYRLRVCKDCRADWLHAIGDWFRNISVDLDPDGPVAYIRDMGTNRPMTDEEIRNHRKGE